MLRDEPISEKVPTLPCVCVCVCVSVCEREVRRSAHAGTPCLHSHLRAISEKVLPPA